MNTKNTKIISFITALLLIITSFKSIAQPTGFVDEVYVDNLTKGVGFVCDDVGRFYYWEQVGKIWVISNGVKASSPLIDLSEEIFPSVQMGLLGVVLDPDFLTNGYIYLYYSADPYYIQNYGTPGYDPTKLDGGGVWWTRAALGRLTRYTVTNLNSTFPTINLASRTILLGETLQTGVPGTAYAHVGGAMAFGHDGTLMLITGEGAASDGDTGSSGWSAFQEALDLGIITNAENIGSYRAQLDNSLSGKILRLDPATGNGVPSNPTYNAASPRSPQSRTWGKGFRNPFRLTHIEETGSHYPEDGNPGTFLVADVGENYKEEVSIINASGFNYGWPKYEGIDHQTTWASAFPDISSNQHKRPIIEYRSSQGRTWYNNNSIELIGGSVVTGTTYMNGVCTVGGTFYDKTDFPSQYQNNYFMADYDSKQIFAVNINSTTNNLVSVNNFFQAPGKVSYINTNPVLNGLFYVSGGGEIATQLRRLRYDTGNQPPVVLLKANPIYGTGSVNVSFDGSNSYDPEGSNVTYLWNFGDGNTSTISKPTYTFTSAAVIKYKVKLTVTDDLGASRSDSVYISVNNTPPVIISTSLANINTIPANQGLGVTLTANVTDAEHTNAQLTYRWVIVLAHNGHEHIEADLTGNNIAYSIPATDCDAGGATYWQRVYLTVTDPLGLSATYYKDILPTCGHASQTITFPQIADKLTADTPFQLNATASSGLSINYFVIQGPANVIGNTLTLTGTPGIVKVRAVQHGSTSFDPALPVDITFNVNKAQIAIMSINLTATVLSSTTAKLDWSFPSGTYTQYDILKDGVVIGTVNEPTHTFNVPNLVAGVTYKFVIRGKDALGNSTLSQNVLIKIPTNICNSTPQYLSDLTWTSATSGYHDVALDKSTDNGVITLNGTTYTKGLGAHAQSEIIYNLNGAYSTFISDVGIDDEVVNNSCGQVKFLVYTDNTLQVQTPSMLATSATVSINLNVTGVSQLKLVIDMDNGVLDCDHGDWAGARLLSCSADIIPPSKPSNITLSNQTSTSVTLTWNASTDNVGVTGYDIYKDGVLVGSTTTATTFTVSGINASSVITIQAKDAAGNVAVSDIVPLSLCAFAQILSSPSNDYITGSVVQIITNETINASNIVDTGSNVLYKAKKSVLLTPGFQAKAGAVFLAIPVGCN